MEDVDGVLFQRAPVAAGSDLDQGDAVLVVREDVVELLVEGVGELADPPEQAEHLLLAVEVTRERAVTGRMPLHVVGEQLVHGVHVPLRERVIAAAEEIIVRMRHGSLLVLPCDLRAMVIGVKARATIGLPALVTIVDASETRRMADPSPEIVELEPQEAIAVRGELPIAELPRFFERAFDEAARAASESGVEIVGPPFGFYPEMPTETVTVEAGFPVSSPTEAHGDAHRIVLPGGRAVQTTHVGPYDTMEKTYNDLQSWMADQGVEPAVGMWESYLSDPEVEPDPTTWRTRIIWPLA